jgi:hypothetical protein
MGAQRSRAASAGSLLVDVSSLLKINDAPSQVAILHQPASQFCSDECFDNKAQTPDLHASLLRFAAFYLQPLEPQMSARLRAPGCVNLDNQRLVFRL